MNAHVFCITSRISELEDPIVSIIEQMSRISVAFKYWRTPATDVFNDSKFFAATAEAGLKWRTVITSMIETDKSALTELIGACIEPRIYFRN
jgi:hypothetical protein